MSQEESIYNLIPKECSEQEKHPRHKSKFRRRAIDELAANKSLNKTLGPAKVETRPPDLYLKKHEKEPRLPPRNNDDPSQKFTYSDSDRKRPPVPAHDERPVMGLHTTKNYINENALENIHAVPRKPERSTVDTRYGAKQLLEPSGLEPVHVHKKDYGVTPAYVIKRKEEIKKAQDEYDAYVAEHFRRGTMKQLSEREREEILSGLKSNWEQLQSEFLHLSVVVDTVPKIQYKERMEMALTQLEKDIELLESHRVIYVAN